jgi:hypothetical protein
VNGLERALRHFAKLVENGLLDAIDKRVEEYELSEIEDAVVTERVGEHPYLADEEEHEVDYADAFAYAVAEVHRRLWPTELP